MHALNPKEPSPVQDGNDTPKDRASTTKHAHTPRKKETPPPTQAWNNDVKKADTHTSQSIRDAKREAHVKWNNKRIRTHCPPEEDNTPPILNCRSAHKNHSDRAKGLRVQHLTFRTFIPHTKRAQPSNLCQNLRIPTNVHQKFTHTQQPSRDTPISHCDQLSVEKERAEDVASTKN